jgi:hypothetical protein
LAKNVCYFLWYLYCFISLLIKKHSTQYYL